MSSRCFLVTTDVHIHCFARSMQMMTDRVQSRILDLACAVCNAHLFRPSKAHSADLQSVYVLLVVLSLYMHNGPAEGALEACIAREITLPTETINLSRLVV
jgi:hypothetical protein